MSISGDVDIPGIGDVVSKVEVKSPVDSCPVWLKSNVLVGKW